MFEKPEASHTLGLDIDTFSLKGVAIALSRGKPKLEAFFDYSTKPDPTEANPDNVKPLYTSEQQAQLETQLNTHLVVTALETQEVLMRPLELKIKKERDIDAVLAFQAEPILPYPVENAVLDKIIHSQDAVGSKLTLTSARKDHLASHLEQWNTLGVEPEVISAAPLALALFAKEFADTSELCYILHLGWSHSLCTLIENGKPIAAQAIPGGITGIVETISKEQHLDIVQSKRCLIDDEFLPARATQGFKSALETLRIAITRTIYSLAKQIKGKEVANLIVTGPGALIPGFAENIAKSLNKTLLNIPNAPTFGMNSAELIEFALPIGQALSALTGTKDQINFRQGEFAYPARWKRLKIPIAIYMTLCITLALCLGLYEKAYIKHQEGIIKFQYLDLLAGMNRSYPDFERDYNAKVKTNPRHLDIGEIVSIADITPEEIKQRLQFLENEVQAIPQIYPLQPNAPLVSDVLAWISTHPAFIGKTAKGDAIEPSEAPIDEPNSTILSQTLQVEVFQYTMVKRPDPTKKQEKYQIKVELEFSSPTPKMAREFHDALIAPNDIVDPKAEIKWTSNRDRYRTSFYLKDKTLYPAP